MNALYPFGVWRMKQEKIDNSCEGWYTLAVYPAKTVNNQESKDCFSEKCSFAGKLLINQDKKKR